MILKDNLTKLLLKMEPFMTKKGQDITIRRELIELINQIFDESSLDAIYINHTDNYIIPDVVVLPLYHKDFAQYLMDGDLSNVCPFGYTVEIHERCFRDYNAEELTALILHDILQNVQSCTAKERFLKAYNNVLSDIDNEIILDLFNDISLSEICFMAFLDICSRPFKAPIEDCDYVATDEVLKGMGLADAYDSYLEKALPMDLDTVEDRITKDTKFDYRTMRTIIRACMDKDIRHYYTMIRNATPLVCLENVFAGKSTISSLGFVSRKRDFKRNYAPLNKASEMPSGVMTESWLNPKSEIEIRYQLDKIVSDMRYASTEGDREVILLKIKNLTIKMIKTKGDIEKKLLKNPNDATYKHQMEFVMNMLDMLEMYRIKVRDMEIKQKRYGVFIQYPTGYDFDSPIY